MITDILLGILVALYALTMITVLAAMGLADLETFRAIDEKIARFIKGDDDDER